MRQIGARIHVETGFRGANVGVVDGGGELLLVDAPQLPTDAATWSASVAALGTARWLVHTDQHADHTMGNAWVPGTVVAQRETARRLVEAPPDDAYRQQIVSALDRAGLPRLDGYALRVPERVFDDALTLAAGDRRVELIHVGGHAPGTSLVHVPADGVLFTGDAVCECGLPGFGDADLAAVLAALDTAAQLDFDTLVPGHGEVAGRELLGRFGDWVRELVGRVADARDAGVPRAEAAATIRFPDRIHADPAYPPHLREALQRGSIERLYDELERDPALRGR